jgi:hypothetical protein
MEGDELYTRRGREPYSQVLWSLASVYLPEQGLPPTYPYRKVWREGLEVAIKVKGSKATPA